MLIGEIAKSSIEKIMVNLSEYKGYTFIDVRVYFEDDTGEWKPTKKDITVAPDKIDELIELLRKSQIEIKEVKINGISAL